MSILSGFKKLKRHVKTSDNEYQLISQWTSSQSVEMDSGKTLEDTMTEKVNYTDIAEEYDPTKIYTSNSLCLHNNTLYKCKITDSDITGEFNSSNWKAITVGEEIDTSRWKWLGDFNSNLGISVADYVDIAREFLVVVVIPSTTGADVALENHFFNSTLMSQYIAIDSYYYSPQYYACVAHQYNRENGTINLFTSWTNIVGTDMPETGIFSRVFYK